MSVVDDYLARIDAPKRTALARIRKIVRRVVPEAEEVISYGMPAFKYKGKYLVGFNVFKDHMSLFPASGPIAALQSKLADFKLAKGTIQFTLEHQIPASTIEAIVRHRMADIEDALRQ